MAYSQALIKFGYIKGAGLAKSIQTETSPNDYRYMTDGLPANTWKYYYDNKKDSLIESYSKGKLNGPRLFYDKKGKLLKEEPFVYDKISGIVMEYYPNGNQKGSTVYKSNKKHGEIISYYENGSIESKGKYAANRMVGEWIYYDKKGNKIKKETYENNKLVSEETF